MTSNYQINLIIGIILATPPGLTNIVHDFIDVIAITAHPSFSKIVPLLKLGVLIFGYFLIVLSLLQAQKLKEHKVHKYHKI